MENNVEFKDYLIYDNEGNIIGIIKQAPMRAKIAFRNWYIAQQDLERLRHLFTENQ